MKATIKDFFGSNLEQEVLDEVVILPVSIRNKSTGTITLPPNHTWDDFESVEFYLGISTNPNVYASDTLTTTMMAAYPSTWALSMSFAAGNMENYHVNILASSATQATWSGYSSVSGRTVWPHHVVGRKRRYSRVGIDELMSAMSLPNLIANADLTDNPINQRNFNGDWSSLAVGAYGYDQWMKVSSTHMGYVVEAGKYRPSTKHTLTKDDVVIGEFMSPASGHWIVSVPFATSGKFDLYAGQFKRPWHPVLDGLLRCQRYYEQKTISCRAYISGDQFGSYMPFGSESILKYYKQPSVFVLSSGTGNGALTVYTNGYLRYAITSPNSQLGMHSVDNFKFALDASITLAEVNGQITTIG